MSHFLYTAKLSQSISLAAIPGTIFRCDAQSISLKFRVSVRVRAWVKGRIIGRVRFRARFKVRVRKNSSVKKLCITSKNSIAIITLCKLLQYRYYPRIL